MRAISEAASLGLHAAWLLARDPGARKSTADLARALGASPAHLAKVLRRLGRAGLVRSTRGPGGGSVLARPPSQISLLEVYEAVEGPLRPIGCLLARPVCRPGCCVLGGLLAATDQRLREHLAKTRLSAFAPCEPATTDRGTGARRRAAGRRS